jgi:hypothetical protein
MPDPGRVPAVNLVVSPTVCTQLLFCCLLLGSLLVLRFARASRNMSFTSTKRCGRNGEGCELTLPAALPTGPVDSAILPDPTVLPINVLPGVNNSPAPSFQGVGGQTDIGGAEEQPLSTSVNDRSTLIVSEATSTGSGATISFATGVVSSAKGGSNLGGGAVAGVAIGS